MAGTDTSGRVNQKRRTRKALLQAAARLLQQGLRPTLEEIADEAMVSRATAYRYFPGVEALLLEASLDVAVPEPDALFHDAPADDLYARLDLLDAALHEMIVTNEIPLRMMLAHSLERGIRPDEVGELPRRQNRRTPLIEAALEPAKPGLTPETADRLSKALALIVGVEAMVVCKDVLQLDDAETRTVKRWAIHALLDAAQRQARKD